MSSFVTGLGFGLSRELKYDDMTWVPELKIMGLHDWMSRRVDSVVSFVEDSGTSGSFTFRGNRTSRDFLSLGLRTTAFSSDSWSLTAYYAGQYSHDYRAHGGGLKLSYQF